ncbi:MAG: iron-containing alcohol dehydrogenase [Candidatus Phlomobacter fragariae]
MINFAITGSRITPLLSVTEPELMLGLSSEIYCCLGMNSLTYAIEAYVLTTANPVTAACVLSAIKILSNALRRAVNYSLDLRLMKIQYCVCPVFSGYGF